MRKRGRGCEAWITKWEVRVSQINHVSQDVHGQSCGVAESDVALIV